MPKYPHIELERGRSGARIRLPDTFLNPDGYEETLMSGGSSAAAESASGARVEPPPPQDLTVFDFTYDDDETTEASSSSTTSAAASASSDRKTKKRSDPEPPPTTTLYSSSSSKGGKQQKRDTGSGGSSSGSSNVGDGGGAAAGGGRAASSASKTTTGTAASSAPKVPGEKENDKPYKRFVWVHFGAGAIPMNYFEGLEVISYTFAQMGEKNPGIQNYELEIHNELVLKCVVTLGTVKSRINWFIRDTREYTMACKSPYQLQHTDIAHGLVRLPTTPLQTLQGVAADDDSHVISRNIASKKQLKHSDPAQKVFVRRTYSTDARIGGATLQDHIEEEFMVSVQALFAKMNSEANRNMFSAAAGYVVILSHPLLDRTFYVGTSNLDVSQLQWWMSEHLPLASMKVVSSMYSIDRMQTKENFLREFPDSCRHALVRDFLTAIGEREVLMTLQAQIQREATDPKTQYRRLFGFIYRINSHRKWCYLRHPGEDTSVPLMDDVEKGNNEILNVLQRPGILGDNEVLEAERAMDNQGFWYVAFSTREHMTARSVQEHLCKHFEQHKATCFIEMKVFVPDSDTEQCMVQSWCSVWEIMKDLIGKQIEAIRVRNRSEFNTPYAVSKSFCKRILEGCYPLTLSSPTRVSDDHLDGHNPLQARVNQLQNTLAGLEQRHENLMREKNIVQSRYNDREVEIRNLRRMLTGSTDPIPLVGGGAAAGAGGAPADTFTALTERIKKLESDNQKLRADYERDTAGLDRRITQEVNSARERFQREAREQEFRTTEEYERRAEHDANRLRGAERELERVEQELRRVRQEKVDLSREMSELRGELEGRQQVLVEALSDMSEALNTRLARFPATASQYSSQAAFLRGESSSGGGAAGGV